MELQNPSDITFSYMENMITANLPFPPSIQKVRVLSRNPNDMIVGLVNLQGNFI